MKRIYSCFLAILFSFIAFFIFAINIAQIVMHEPDAKMIFLGIPLAVFLLYLAYSAKIDYNEECLRHFALWKRKEVSYSDIARISCSGIIGLYWLITYNNEKYGLNFPLEHKKMMKVFDAIKNANPNVQIDVWWYKKQPRATILKTSLKFCLFVLIVLLADFLLHIFKK